MSAPRCDSEKALTTNRFLDTLSNNLRRELIHYFENFASDETASLETVVAHLGERVPTVDETELRLSLRHTHLPKLEERGWVEYDERTKAIRYYGHAQPEELLADASHVFNEKEPNAKHMS